MENERKQIKLWIKTPHNRSKIRENINFDVNVLSKCTHMAQKLEVRCLFLGYKEPKECQWVIGGVFKLHPQADTLSLNWLMEQQINLKQINYSFI